MINDTNSHMIVNIYKLKTTVNKQQFKWGICLRPLVYFMTDP
jgi:hypothetical protein